MLWAVRWHCRYGVSYRDLGQMMGERGVAVDHGKLKQLIRPVRGFKTLKMAYATINGFEVMRALRQGQASAFNLTRDIRGEARIVERALGLGASLWAEAVQFVSKRLGLEAACQARRPDPAPSCTIVGVWRADRLKSRRAVRRATP